MAKKNQLQDIIKSRTAASVQLRRTGNPFELRKLQETYLGLFYISKSNGKSRPSAYKIEHPDTNVWDWLIKELKSQSVLIYKRLSPPVPEIKGYMSYDIYAPSELEASLKGYISQRTILKKDNQIN